MIPYFTSSVLADLPFLSHGFTTRNGGVSTGDFTSLNTSFSTGDNPENVLENRHRICQTFGQKNIVTCHQVHSNHVVMAQDVALATPADAIISTTPGVLIGIMSADCVPVLLADETGKAVAAIHAGWRSATSGILENTISTLEKLGCKRQHLRAAIGPCIWQESYEVCPDFYSNLPDVKHLFIPSTNENHWMFDLPGYVQGILMQNEIPIISPPSHNTYTNPDLFFSCRRRAHKNDAHYGCSLSVIQLKEIA